MQRRGQYASSCFVICIGNITAGGTGKTPSAAALMALIKAKRLFKKPCFLMRGYGGNIKAPLFVGDQHNANDVGDEALLLKHHADVVISKNRKDGLKLIEEHGYDCVIMDDGLQNQTIRKDFSILVTHAQKGFGNNKTIPAGPLREPLHSRIDDIDLSIWTELEEGQDPPNAIRPCVTATLQADKKAVLKLTNKKLLAFAGIAHPDRFFDTLKNQGLQLEKTAHFPDHHHFSDKDVDGLCSQAKQNNLSLITTEKDYVRLPVDMRDIVYFLPITYKFSDEQLISDLLIQKRDNQQ